MRQRWGQTWLVILQSQKTHLYFSPGHHFWPFPSLKGVSSDVLFNPNGVTVLLEVNHLLAPLSINAFSLWPNMRADTTNRIPSSIFLVFWLFLQSRNSLTPNNWLPAASSYADFDSLFWPFPSRTASSCHQRWRILVVDAFQGAVPPPVRFSSAANALWTTTCYLMRNRLPNIYSHGDEHCRSGETGADAAPPASRPLPHCTHVHHFVFPFSFV